MKQLKNCYDEIYKCSKCGLCQKVCPVFKITQNEAALSRGKFLMLLSYLEDKIPFSKTLKKYLNMCTSCGACSKFCPSGIDANKIFNLAKFEQKISKFSLKSILGNIFYHFSKINFNNKKTHSQIVLFEGCYAKFLNSKTKKSTLKILSDLNYEAICPNFGCCGIVAQSTGDKKLFEKFMKHNLEILKKTEIKYVLFDCATCLDVVKNYDKYFEIENFDKIKTKCISVVEFLQKQNVKFCSPEILNVTYHKPCHIDFDLQKLIKDIKNINYVQMEDYDKCCGFAGKFAIQNNKIAKEMFKLKAKNIEKTDADIVLTYCPGCVEGLKMAKKYIKKQPKIINLVEFLSHLKIIS